jgi:hypothetical protein
LSESQALSKLPGRRGQEYYSEPWIIRRLAKHSQKVLKVCSSDLSRVVSLNMAKAVTANSL